MPNQDVLAQLRDIHLPQPIGWWPLAPGWIALCILLLVAGVILGGYAHRRRVQGRAKRAALLLLDAAKKTALEPGKSTTAAATAGELLRRVALAYYPREQVAGLEGDAWIAFLNQTGNGVDFNQCRNCLLVLPYQAPRDQDLTDFFNHAKKWIKQRGAPCLN